MRMRWSIRKIDYYFSNATSATISAANEVNAEKYPTIQFLSFSFKISIYIEKNKQERTDVKFMNEKQVRIFTMFFDKRFRNIAKIQPPNMSNEVPIKNNKALNNVLFLNFKVYIADITICEITSIALIIISILVIIPE